MKTWLKQVVDSFKVGENFARFAMVHYNKEWFDAISSLFLTANFSTSEVKLFKPVQFEGRPVWHMTVRFYTLWPPSTSSMYRPVWHMTDLNHWKTNKIEFGIDENPTNDQVSAAIDRVQYRKGGKTFTGKALEVAKGLFKHEDGRKEVMILLTGES